MTEHSPVNQLKQILDMSLEAKNGSGLLYLLDKEFDSKVEDLNHTQNSNFDHEIDHFAKAEDLKLTDEERQNIKKVFVKASVMYTSLLDFAEKFNISKLFAQICLSIRSGKMPEQDSVINLQEILKKIAQIEEVEQKLKEAQLEIDDILSREQETDILTEHDEPE